MKLAARASRVVPSPTLSITATAKAMAAQGIDVVDFASGEPDFDTPEPVKAAAEAAIRAGFTKYTPSSGIDELRTAIADKLKAEQGLQYEKSQILVSCVAKHSLYNIAEALLEAGDELIIPAPFWVRTRIKSSSMTRRPPGPYTRGGGVCHSRKAELESKVTRHTKAIILNSPCNPTGATYDRKTLEELPWRSDMTSSSFPTKPMRRSFTTDARHISIATLGPGTWPPAR